jgi:hypothetical protein
MVEPSSQRIERKGSGRVSKPRTTETIIRRRVLPLALQTAIEQDPVYSIYTCDGRSWIEPLTGTAQPTPPGEQTQDQVRSFFITHLDRWRSDGVMPMETLQEIRWRHDVLLLLKSHKRRMTIFHKTSGLWLNPFSGVIEPDVSRDAGKITAVTVRAMAVALARCPAAQHGKVLPVAEIQKLLGSLGYGEDMELAAAP